MSNFIQYLQVNQNFKYLSQYGGITPLTNGKIWVGIAGQDPKSKPLNVFIIDAEGNKQTIQQPFFTNALGNFVDSEDRTANLIYPQIDEDSYSLYIEFVTDGQLSIYQRSTVAAGFNSVDFQNKRDLKNILDADKTGWNVNAPTALSTDQRFTAIETSAVTKNALSDSIDSNNAQQGASSKAVLNLKNYFSFNNTETEYYQGSQSRLKTGDYGLIKVTIINGGQGGQGGMFNVTDNKPPQFKGGNSGSGIIIWLITEMLEDSMDITIGAGSAASADSASSVPAIPPLGASSKLKVTYQGADFLLSPDSGDAANLHQPFIHDFVYLPANSGDVGQIVWGKDSTVSTKTLSKQGLGGLSPVLIETEKFATAGNGGKSGVCCSDSSVTGAATNGSIGLMIIQRLKV
jgi:hypothetical protein